MISIKNNYQDQSDRENVLTKYYRMFQIEMSRVSVNPDSFLVFDKIRANFAKTKPIISKQAEYVKKKYKVVLVSYSFSSIQLIDTEV